MANKRSNVLRQYHLLVKRELDRFEWQIRYNRHANPVQRSATSYATHVEAAEAGEVALVRIRSEAAASLS